jgi:hypothetical protein
MIDIEPERRPGRPRSRQGELSPDVDPEVAVDLMFGPAMYRLFARHAPLDETAADQIVDTAMRGLSAETDVTASPGVPGAGRSLFQIETVRSV